MHILILATNESDLIRIENSPTFRRNKWKIERFLDFIKNSLELLSSRPLGYRSLLKGRLIPRIHLKLTLALFQLRPEVKDSFLAEKSAEKLSFALWKVLMMESLQVFKLLFCFFSTKRL